MLQFSVIIPVRNGQRFLKNALTSIVNQRADNVEVLVINDSSTDKTAEIAKQYASKYNYIRLINSVGQGVSSARNTGIQNSQGDYVLFLDVDDFYVNNAFSSFEKLIAANNSVDVIFSGYRRVTADGSLIKNFSYSYSSGNGVNVAIEYLNKKAFTHLGAFCFKRNLLVEKSLIFQPELNYAEDIVFISKVLFEAKTVVALETETYCWTLRMGSTLYTNTLEKFNSLEALSYLRRYLSKKDEFTETVDRAICTQYALLLLDSAASLLWMGSSVWKVRNKINEIVDWDMIPSFENLAKNIRNDVIFLKHTRTLYLVYKKLFYIPYNFRIKGIKKYRTKE